MQAANQVDSSTTSELVALQDKIKFLKNQNSSLIQTNAMYNQQNIELINKCQELENRNENLSQELTVLNHEFEEFKVQFAELKQKEIDTQKVQIELETYKSSVSELVVRIQQMQVSKIKFINDNIYLIEIFRIFLQHQTQLQNLKQELVNINEKAEQDKDAYKK